MAATARRIGLSTRCRRKLSREEDTRSRKTSSARRVSREENTSSLRSTRQACGLQKSENYCPTDTVAQRFQNNDLTPKISRPEGNVCLDTGSVERPSRNNPRGKISVYARPESLERKINHQAVGSQARWQEFLIQYEPLILSIFALLIVSVSIYIVFVERQRLF